MLCNFHGELSKGETISLKFTARVWNATLAEVKRQFLRWPVWILVNYINLILILQDFKDYEKVIIKSHGKLVLTDDIHDDNQQDNENSVVTLAYSNITFKSEPTLPIWLFITSVLIGLGVLILLIIACWKVKIHFYLSRNLDTLLFICILFSKIGFFERKKYGDEKYLDESSKSKKTPYWSLILKWNRSIINNL